MTVSELQTWIEGKLRELPDLLRKTMEDVADDRIRMHADACATAKEVVKVKAWARGAAWMAALLGGAVGLVLGAIVSGWARSLFAG